MTDATDLYHSGHRERLRQKFVDNNITDYELLELLLSYAIPRRDVRPLSRCLMARFDGVYNVMTAPMDKLMEVSGLGRNTAIFIAAMHRAFITAQHERLKDVQIFKDTKEIGDYCKSLFAGKIIEEFHLFYLDSQRRLIQTDLHSCGTTGWASVYVREIVKRALALNASYVFIAHNHPVPCKKFSTPDVEITVELKAALEYVEVTLIDHFMVSDGILYSMDERGIFKSSQQHDI